MYLGRAVCAARCSPRTQQLSGHSAHTRESMRSSVRVSVTQHYPALPSSMIIGHTFLPYI